MEKKEIKNLLRKELSMWVGSKEVLSPEFIQQKTQAILMNLQSERKLDLSDHDKQELIESLCDDFLGLGPLQKLMMDEHITEIMVNGPKTIYIEKEGKKSLTDITFDDEAHLRYIIEKMLSPTGRRVDESSPYVDFSLEDGSRVNVIIPPLAVGGAVVTIRKFLQSLTKIEDLVRLKTIDENMASFLCACINAKLNILFSGATGSGKTTTLEILSNYIDPSERIVTIEDALELNLHQKHIVRLLTRLSNIEGKGGISLRELFRNTLRMRPNRIILGEIRGAEAIDYIQALNSGHRGCLAVIHAASPADALMRLETMALYAGLNIAAWAIREQISSGLDLIIQQEQLHDGSRKITHITEVGQVQDNQIVLHDIFRYELQEAQQKDTVAGKFVVGSKPSFLDKLKQQGISFDATIFPGAK